MNEFKVGDIVRRIEGGSPDLPPGSDHTVAEVMDNGERIKVAGYASVWRSEYFTLTLRPEVFTSEVDIVNHPPHYTSDPSGVECIMIARHRTFNIGNALKYLWRLGLKDSTGKTAKEKTLEDLDKAIWYLRDERKRIEGLA